MTRSQSGGQLDVFALLQDPATYGRTEPVIRIGTHGAAVFLAGPDVYKVKRATRLPCMDFSTLEKRHAVCEAELSQHFGAAQAENIGTDVVDLAVGEFEVGHHDMRCAQECAERRRRRGRHRRNGPKAGDGITGRFRHARPDLMAATAPRCCEPVPRFRIA